MVTGSSGGRLGVCTLSTVESGRSGVGGRLGSDYVYVLDRVGSTRGSDGSGRLGG